MRLRLARRALADAKRKKTWCRYWATSVRIAVFLGPAWGLLWSWLFSLSVKESFARVYWPYGFYGGVAFGVSMGAVGAFFARAITVTLPVAVSKAAFMTEATLRLAEIGYHQETVIEDPYTFGPSWAAGRCADRITVVVDPVKATVLGPAAPVRRFVKSMGVRVRS